MNLIEHGNRQELLRPPHETRAKLFEMVLCVSKALDLLHPAIADHHLRTAYIACCLAEQMGLPETDVRDLLIASALHDAGAVTAGERLHLLSYTLGHHQPEGTSITDDRHMHAIEGYELMRRFSPFAQAARTIRFHHVDWRYGEGQEESGETVPFAAHILHLADRVAVLPASDRNVLQQAGDIRKVVAEGDESLYGPDIVASFQEVSARESFWLDVASAHKERIISQRFAQYEIELNLEAMRELAELFGKIVDYRSPFTARHSSAVASIAEELGRRSGICPTDRQLLGIAGHLHDIGKLSVPAEILDRKGKLSEAEKCLIRQHPYYTFHILSSVSGLETVSVWASLHHERLDGRGYPFRPAEIPLGSRIVAVSDVFAAICEDRPYRLRMTPPESRSVLQTLVEDGALDGDIVAILSRDYDEFRNILDSVDGRASHGSGLKH